MKFRQLGFFGAALGVVAMFGGTTSADVIEDFEGGLSGFTSTVILDAQVAGSNTSAFQITGGALELNTSAYNGIEQIAYIKDGWSLGVGDTVLLDVNSFSGNRNMGLYVGGTAPVTHTFGDPGSRFDNITNYTASSGSNIATRGHDGSSEYGNIQNNNANLESLFIRRVAINVYDVGYIAAGVETVYATRTPAFPNDAEFVGIYADVRAVGTLSSVDNLRIVTAVPEPSSLALLGLASVAGLSRRRKR